MTEPDTSWREGRAGELGRDVKIIGDTVRHLENVHAMSEADGDEQTCQEIRNLQARFRLKAADLLTKQRDLMAAANPQPQLPMAMTVRRLRPLEEHAGD